MAANNAKQRSASTVHDLRQLRRKVYECLFLMNKADRIVYGNRLADYAANTAMWFIRSYEEREAGEKLRCAREAAM